MLNYYGTWILTDPVFATTIGLDFGALGRIGLKRHAPLPIQVEEIPPIDIVLISHAHLDHLDVQSLQALKNKRKTRVITSINTGSLIKNLHFRKVVELAWNHTFSVDNIQIKAFSTKHYGARTPLDLDFNDDKKNGMGYNSYLVTTEGKAGFFFMGDTGFTRRFKSKISSKIDLVLMPVGGYNPWEKDHVNPVQALRMAVDLGAKKLMPIHWGTFAVGNEGNSEPIEVLQEAVVGKPLKVVGIDRKPVIINKSSNNAKRSIIIPHETLKIKLKDHGNGPGDHNYDIYLNDDYAGHAYFNVKPPGIYEIEIEKNHRRKGIAEAVYSWIEEKYFQDQFMKIEAYASARKFWEKMGYEFDHVEEYEGHEPSGKPYLIIMTKQA